jgi:ketosteroid isomerase-like protein
MPHPHERLLRANYEAFTKGDMNPMLDSLTHDIQWHVSGPSPVAGDYSGKGEVVDFFAKMMELYGGTLRIDVIDVLANDDHGIVLTRERGEHAGKAVEYEGVHRWHFRAGECARFENYYDDAYQEFWRAA